MQLINKPFEIHRGLITYHNKDIISLDHHVDFSAVSWHSK